MKKIIVPCQSRGGVLPVYQSAAASGADLAASNEEEIILKAGAWAMVPTGLHLEIPQGFEAQVRPRSGLAAKHGVTVLNAPGTIDADYRGEVKVILINHGSGDFVIRKGDRIAQLVFAAVTRAEFNAEENLAYSQRGENGFGSTGITSHT